MSFVSRERRNELPVKQNGLLATSRSMLDTKPEAVLFYEYEAALVVDVILDENHPAIKNKTILPEYHPKNLDGSDPKETDMDMEWIGRIKVRMIVTNRGTLNENLQWAYPLENTGVVELPLVNEMVSVVEYDGRLYYTKKINIHGFVNANASFTAEPHFGVNESVREYGTTDEFVGKTSTINISEQGTGKLGKTFVYNPRIRQLKKYEGDTIIESRVGSSIRFGSYEENKSVNESNSGYTDYPQGTGNPHLLIRNRQGDLNPSVTTANLPKGYTTESINNDGSSIHLTSGKTTSQFMTTCKKVMLQSGVSEEQSKFSPSGITSFQFPTLTGDQIVINSDRLIFQSRGEEFFQYAKKRFSIVTDSEYTVDAHDQIVLTTNQSTSINSPFIFLGEAYQMAEPALLGRTTTYWTYQLCEWLSSVIDWQISLCNDWLAAHEHDTKKDPTLAPKGDWKAKMEKHVSDLKKLQKTLHDHRDKLPRNLSQRVFLTGGGGAPGFGGGELSK